MMRFQSQNPDQQAGFGSSRLQGRSAGAPRCFSSVVTMGNGEEAPSGRHRLLANQFERD
jgi:hypothetical protein